MTQKKKKSFKWENGSRLSSEDYDPLGNIRDIGFTKLADGLYADPIKRREARKKKLTRLVQSRQKDFFSEVSESGLNREITPSEASHLIRKKDEKFKGLLRFQKDSGKKQPQKK